MATAAAQRPSSAQLGRPALGRANAALPPQPPSPPPLQPAAQPESRPRARRTRAARLPSARLPRDRSLARPQSQKSSAARHSRPPAAPQRGVRQLVAARDRHLAVHAAQRSLRGPLGLRAATAQRLHALRQVPLRALPCAPPPAPLPAQRAAARSTTPIGVQPRLPQSLCAVRRAGPPRTARAPAR